MSIFVEDPTDQKMREKVKFLFDTGVLPSSYKKEIINNKVVTNKEISEAKLDEAMAIGYYGYLHGLNLFSSLTNIMNINGKMCIWGDVITSQILSKGLISDYRLWFDEEKQTAHCVIKRKGFESPMEQTFSIDDAKRAGLLSKNGAVWSQYPKRMCQVRAKVTCIKELFSDILEGLSIREEVDDYNTRDDMKTKTVSSKLSTLLEQLADKNTVDDITAFWKEGIKDLNQEERTILSNESKNKKDKIIGSIE